MTHKIHSQDMTESSFNEDLITVQNNKNEPENYSHQEIPATTYSL